MTQHARSLADLVRYDPDGTRVVLVPAGTVGVVRRVIPQEGMPYPDLEVEYPNGTVERSPADSFEPVPAHEPFRMVGTEGYCDLHQRTNCDLCDECDHPAYAHVEDFAAPTCWASFRCGCCPTPERN